MSIRAQFYITGDTQQSGFRRIGSSESFPADHLPLLNNGEVIQEKARVEAGGGSQGAAGIQVLSHVWEYQTGRFGVPVMINTMVAIGTGRAHGFSEYVAGETDNVAEQADAGQMIAGAENFDLLDAETFMSIPGWDTIPCPEDAEWKPEEAAADAGVFEVEDVWRKTVLAHYWKQASIRAFSVDAPTTVRVNLGEFNDDVNLDTEETIRQAKRFFSSVIVPGLPKQVQNIASMAAGVNAADQGSLYAAIEFDITQNMYEEETLRIDRPQQLRNYRLYQGELDFISEVSSGKTPEAVTAFFNHYKDLIENPELTETQVPFMADYRVWFALYCIDHVTREKHSFVEKAGLMNEHGNPNRIRDARACYLLMQNLRRLLEEDHKLSENSKRRNLVTELTEDLEAGLMKVMLENMNEANAEPFLIRRNEMVEFHRRTLYTVTNDQVDDYVALAVRDAEVSKAPQFVRCYPATPIRNEQADERNAKLLAALLPAVFTRRIEAEKRKENVEDKYLDQLRSPDFADNWACQSQSDRTRQAVADFLRKEIEDPQKHFLLYKISLKYIPENELFCVTMKHFTERNTAPNARPEERHLRIARHGAEVYVAGAGSVDPECVRAMNRYYQACFREYRASIGNISEDIIKRLGGDTTEAMILIFNEYAEGAQLNADEVKAVFSTFGGKEIGEDVIAAYTGMMKAQREAALADPAADRRPLVRWLSSMVEAAPFEIDTAEDMIALFNHAAAGERMTSEEAESLFTGLDPDSRYAVKESVITAYSRMIAAHQAKILEDPEQDPEASRETMVRWVANMVEKAPFKVDTSDSIRAAFENARTGERMGRATAQQIFDKLMPNAVSGEEKVKPGFHSMIRDQLDTALKNKDDSVLEWIGSMISVAGDHISYDTTDVLKKIFESAKEGERMHPADAGTIFDSMSDKADGLNTVVQRNYNEMLAVRRREVVEKKDEDGFTWLCEMADKAPWSADAAWLAEQHTENVTALCEISRATDKPIDSIALGTAQIWLEKGEMTPRGATQLQKYCNEQLEKGNDEPANALVSRFGVIDSSCEALRKRVFDGAVTRMKEGLDKPDVSFSMLVESCRGDVEKAGKRLDDLYNETREETESFVTRHFDSTSDLESLDRELERLPSNSSFNSTWQKKLSDKVFGRQVEMFNRQPNLEKLVALKTDLLNRSGNRLEASLTAAYELMESYENRLAKLKDKTEYEAVTSIGEDLGEMHSMLHRAAEVRKTLCTSLRSARFPVQEELRDKSFRHALCASAMQAMLTDTEREVAATDGTGKEKGCPDWTKVLNSLFPKAELDNAIKKPYAEANLPVLQRLLALVENARMMSVYGMKDAWAADLVRSIHSHPDLHRYQSALGRNKKMSEQYHLSFDTDGLVFSLESN